MKKENKIQEVMEKLRVKDLDFQSNQITFINEGKITFLHMESDKMDVLKDLCIGKTADDLLFSDEKKRSKRKGKTFYGSAAYGDDVVIALKDVILNHF